MRKFILAFTLVFWASSSIAQVEHLYLNSGTNNSLDSLSFPQLAINTDPTFSSRPAILRLNQGDSLKCWVHNNTLNSFDLSLEGYGSFSLAAMDSVYLSTLPTAKQQLLYVESDFPRFKNMGAVALIHVDQPGGKHFYWCLQEFESEKNFAIDSGFQVDWSTYYPDAYFINGEAKPDIDLDSTAKVTGAVGDTIYIHMANMGAAAHSIHFHGYHASVIFSNQHPHHFGRSKDTFPLLPMECVSLMLVPNQPGEYPVHDHNLVAVSGKSIYPNGMFLTLVIQE